LKDTSNSVPKKELISPFLSFFFIRFDSIPVSRVTYLDKSSFHGIDILLVITTNNNWLTFQALTQKCLVIFFLFLYLQEYPQYSLYKLWSRSSQLQLSSSIDSPTLDTWLIRLTSYEFRFIWLLKKYSLNTHLFT